MSEYEDNEEEQENDQTTEEIKFENDLTEEFKNCCG